MFTVMTHAMEGDCYVARYQQFPTRQEAVTFFSENEAACLLYEGSAPEAPRYLPPSEIRPVYTKREVARVQLEVKTKVRRAPKPEPKPALTLDDIF